jgi:hypothetical protein
MLSDNAVIRKVLDRVGHVLSTRTRQGVSEVSFIRRRRE